MDHMRKGYLVSLAEAYLDKPGQQNIRGLSWDDIAFILRYLGEGASMYWFMDNGFGV